MTLKRLGFFVVLLLVATGAFADENAYRFRASWAADHFEFAGLGGTHWKWLNLGCPKDAANCEVTLDTTGANAANADLAISHVKDQMLNIRCLRDGGCHIVITSDSTRTDTTLKRGSVADLPSGSLISFSASTRPSSSENH